MSQPSSRAMVPSISDVPPDDHNPAAEDACKFPSDEELSQRMFWLSFVVVLGWSILGLTLPFCFI
jgi:hypothetical protein